MGYSEGSTGWRDTWRDPLVSYSDILSGILGGIWPAALAGYSAGSTGEPLWRDTLASSSGGTLVASSSGGVLGGIQ